MVRWLAPRFDPELFSHALVSHALSGNTVTVSCAENHFGPMLADMMTASAMLARNTVKHFVMSLLHVVVPEDKCPECQPYLPYEPAANSQVAWRSESER